MNTEEKHFNTAAIVPLNVVLFGITTFALQIIFLRSFLKLFQGNEFTVGIFYFWWFLSGAIGSFLFRSLKLKSESLFSVFFVLFWIWQVLIICTYLTFNFPQVLLHRFIIKEIVGFSRIHFFCASTLTLMGLISGFIFPLSIALSRERDASSISRVYFLETIGSCVGGIMVSLFFIARIDSGYCVLFLALANLFSIIVYIMERGWATRILYAACIILITVSAFFYRAYIVQGPVSSPDIKVIAAQDSPYQHLRLVRHKDQTTMYLNNSILASTPDRLSAEEAVHMALLLQDNPRNVLITGGLTPDLITELRKYPSLERIDWVFSDAYALSLMKQYFLDQDDSPFTRMLRAVPVDEWWSGTSPHTGVQQGSTGSTRVGSSSILTSFATDIRLFVRNTHRDYDVVIMQYPLPLNISFNYFYTPQFFSEVKEVLAKAGIFSFSIEGSEVFMSGPLRDLVALITRSLQKVFPYVTVLPGENIHFLASLSPISAGLSAYTRGLREKKISTSFINEFYLNDRLSPSRIRFLHDQARQSRVSAVNDAFHPLGYWYSFTLTSLLAKDTVYPIVKRLQPMSMLIVLFLIVPATFLIRFVKSPSSGKAVYYGYAFIHGFVNMAVFFLILITFQIFHGSLYYRAGLLAAAYMLGMSLGGRWVGKYACEDFLKKGIFTYAVGILFFMGYILYSRFSHTLMPESIFYSFSLLLGFAAGGVFILINQKVCGHKEAASAPTVAAKIYGWDLFGACVSAILFPSFVLPLAGVFCSMVFLVLLLFVYVYKLHRSAQIPHNRLTQKNH